MIKLVAFDWGNTVMRDDPDSTIPMVEWPEVENMPGIEEALRALTPAYRLILATNATISTTDQIWGALGRGKLASFFERIFAARELGVSKPDPAFYEIVQAACGCAPAEIVMVGDSYRTDIVGAKQAGWRTVWYNPGGGMPGEPPDAADVTIHHLAELPAAVRALDGA